MLVPLIGCDANFVSSDLSSNGVATDNQNYAAQRFAAHRYVQIARGSGNLPQSDQLGLTHFIADQAGGRAPSVHVVLTGPVAPAELTQLTRALVAAGIDPDKIEYNANKPVDGQAPTGRAGLAIVDVATERWAPVLPACPDQSLLSIRDSSNPNGSNFGCSVATNLGVMISDPRDLVAGETGGHTDAGLTSAAIERLEQDRVKPLVTQSSKSAN